MEKKEKFDSYFNKEDITTSEGFWNYMEGYWHKNREFPESVENHLNRKADLIDGKVPSSQLPSYVDDVLEFNSFENLPGSGEKGKIYLVTNNNTQFRWSGSEYIQINSDENLMTIDTVQDITGHKQFNSGLSLGSNQRMYIKTASDVAHYVANFADDLDGFAVSTGFAVKPYNDTASNWLLVNGAGAYSNGQLLSTQTWANSSFHKKDQTGGINNGSDGRTNTSWFDYNWAGKNAAGSVINFSGFEGYSTELFSSYNAPDLIGIRSRQGDAGVWNDPRWIWHDKNFNPADYYKINRGNVSNQSGLFPNSLQCASLANTGTDFDGDLSNKTFEGTFANFNGYSNEHKQLGFTLAGATSTNHGIYYKTWYGGAETPFRKLWDSNDFTPSSFSQTLPNNGNWNNNPIITERKTIGELAWKNYGNGHTIFDISSGITPWGVAKSNTDAQQPWSPSFPTLVGGNGVGTYGVRVDSARVADTLTGGYSASSFITTDSTPQSKNGNLSFGPNSIVTFEGTEQNSIGVFRQSNAIDTIVSAHTYSFYSTSWKAGNKRGAGVNSLGYAFQFSTDSGTTYSEKVLIQPTGNISTSQFGDSNQWNIAFNRGDFRDYGLGRTNSLTATDLNSLPTTGVYGLEPTTLNSPHAYGNVFNMRYGNNVEYTQLAINTVTGLLKTRGVYSSGTSGWLDYATQSWVANNYGNQTLSVGNEGNVGQQLTLSNGNSVQITNNFVACRDGSRNPNDIKPNENGQRVRYDFANANTVGGSGNYAGVMTYSPWDGTTASTGDSSYQLAFANQTGLNAGGAPMLKIRNGIDNTWSNTWYKIWSEGDFSKTDVDNWNNLANTAATLSWVESQDYATHSFVEESLNKITSEHIDPDYSISARSNLNTIILTDQFPVQFLELESELIPGKQMTIINTASFDIEVRKDGNVIDIVRSTETNEYYITHQQRLVRKGFYRNAKILS